MRISYFLILCERRRSKRFAYSGDRRNYTPPSGVVPLSFFSLIVFKNSDGSLPFAEGTPLLIRYESLRSGRSMARSACTVKTTAACETLCIKERKATRQFDGRFPMTACLYASAIVASYESRVRAHNFTPRFSSPNRKNTNPTRSARDIKNVIAAAGIFRL